jgi:hypothetical protein
MTGVAALVRKRARRSEALEIKRECAYKDIDGRTWQPRHAFNAKGAKRAIERIYDLTGKAYSRYECRNCGSYHIKRSPPRRQAQPW